MEAGAFQSQPEEQPKPAEGTVEGVDEEGQVSTPERSPEEVQSTFDPATGDLAQPESTDPQADGEASDDA
jgi:hypothetical protein